MATVLGVNQTKIEAGGIANLLDKGQTDARSKLVFDTYEASALASGSVIKVCGTLPVGAVIHNIVIMNDAMNANVGISIGDSNDANRYTIANSMTTAQVKTIDKIDGFGYVIGTTAGDNQIYLTTNGASACTGTIKVVVKYANA